MIFTIKNTIRGWPDEFQDIVFENTKASEISNFIVMTVSLNNSWGKKLKKLCFVLKKGMFPAFLVVKENCLKKTSLKRYWGDSFFVKFVKVA